MNIKEVQQESHQIAVDKGFWEEGKRNLSELLMLVVSELGEACEALRKDNRQINKIWRKDAFEDELADAVIRIFDLAESEGIDLEWQIRQKLDYNKTRPKKHGKKF
jgi:NTP pyrophosphatase (non-canonical NTP hydrolase)